MIAYQAQQRAKTNLKMGGIEGIYVPKDGRLESKRAFCSAHFSLGNPNLSKSALLSFLCKTLIHLNNIILYRLPVRLICVFRILIGVVNTGLVKPLKEEPIDEQAGRSDKLA